ncbi:FAD-binding oxidoreductase [Rhodoblastus acidophilus]|uniref:FAD-binding oxidoreductase n=1 Tax=Candidatus Rhodoblastus alkanivorans TaxID=2954117 RepID=A0ABS9Z9D9_9HYPH|nr:FAD-dependent oxidoreductase [Candidatus Rhodoblastus alkanivorans]MCI4680014.1 FAD-binding oxidoreductase [Candidatus Rhodoblastus alkanivorans]MCI4684244.1 FAD-binding oxidoreductase [Candidatus Rhodoblastus alkanivorans]MDI4641564.1 FAD-binding oxidoreductase [Rhodoblastus acidophilus]
MRRTEVLVLGAGIVGVATALQIQARGREVVLVDRRGAGEETSYGNAGLIERASIFPYLFPHDWRALALYAVNGANEARYHLRDLPYFAPWLLRYWWESAPERALRHALAARPLIENSLSEHEKLMAEAGALDLMRKTGWLKLFRSERTFAAGRAAAKAIEPYGLKVALYDSAALSRIEPSLNGVHGAVHYLDPASLKDPLALTLKYLALFEKRGGVFLRGDAKTFRPASAGYGVVTEEGPLTAEAAVVCLGPWAETVIAPLGYSCPLAVKRGYHMHFAPRAVLNHPALDADNGFLLAPMARGIRMTSGAEFARRDAPPDYTQIDASEVIARQLFPLGERLDPKPWIGRRPCLPDMLPIIGPAPRHRGLWFNFGHQHHGLTLAAVTGRLLAEMMTGEKPFADPEPFAIGRFSHQ